MKRFFFNSCFILLLLVLTAPIAFCKNTPIIMDNADGVENGVIINGEWNQSRWKKGGKFYGTDYIHDNDKQKGEKSVEFIPDLSPGEYSVFTRYTSYFNRSKKVPYIIRHSDKITPQYLDQSIHGGKWHLLGTYQFSGKTKESVVIDTKDTQGYVVADGMAFIPVEKVDACPDNLVAYWPFDSIDKIVQDYAGVNIGWVHGAISDTGKNNGAASFDGNDYIIVSDHSTLRLSNQFTLAAWVYETKTESYAKIISRRDDDYFYYLGIDRGRPIGGIGYGESSIITKKSFTMPENEWHHIAFTYNYENNIASIYYDGELKETIEIDFILPKREDVELLIGGDKKGKRHFFTGKIDDACIFNTSLDEAQIKQLFDNGIHSLAVKTQ